MKKFISIILVLCLLLSTVACSKRTNTPDLNGSQKQKQEENTDATNNETSVNSRGKVAIITNTISQNEEEYRSAEEMLIKYGEDKIIHELWPDNFMSEQEQMISIVSKLGSDPDVKALVINQAIPGTNAAVDKLLESRDDIFIVYCHPQENPPDVSKRADLIIETDKLQMGNNIPEQAKKLGAKTFVHYSFPRHMSTVLLSARREIMREKCKEIGLVFVDAMAPDPTGDSGVTGAQQFILEDVPRMVEAYGKDTAFFSTNCSMQIPLIKACLDEGAIYPQPCCPSPYHGFPTALGIESSEFSEDSLKHVVEETTRILDEKGALGRFSTWPVPISMMNTAAATDYAFKWINGEVGDEIDVEVLEQCMADYAKVNVETNAYSEVVNGETVEFSNYKLTIMDFLTYGE